MKIDWHKLTQEQKKVYEDKAAYLLERGYVHGKNKDVLAREMYERLRSNNGMDR
jgi:hypothetical protein